MQHNWVWPKLGKSKEEGGSFEIRSEREKIQKNKNPIYAPVSLNPKAIKSIAITRGLIKGEVNKYATHTPREIPLFRNALKRGMVEQEQKGVMLPKNMALT